MQSIPIDNDRIRKLARMLGLDPYVVQEICESIYDDPDKIRWLNSAPLEEIAYYINLLKAERDAYQKLIAMDYVEEWLDDWTALCGVIGFPWEAALMARSSHLSYADFARDYVERYPFGNPPEDLEQYMIEYMIKEYNKLKDMFNDRYISKEILRAHRNYLLTHYKPFFISCIQEINN